MYITKLASNEVFSPSNKIHREVGQAEDLSAPLYLLGPSGRAVLIRSAVFVGYQIIQPTCYTIVDHIFA